MASDFEQYGLSAIKRVRSRYPAIYLKICTMMLPKEIQVKEDAISRLSDEQLDEYLSCVRDLVAAKRAELQTRGEPVDVTPAKSKPKKGARPAASRPTSSMAMKTRVFGFIRVRDMVARLCR